MLDNYKQRLEELKATSNLRVLPEAETELIDLCSNDYLGLNNDGNLYHEFLDALSRERHSFSSSSSRLLSGNSSEHIRLEEKIAARYQKETCLLYNSGYHANLGILTTLTDKRDLIVADKLVHASLIDGFKLSEADFVRYRHSDYEHLEKILSQKRSLYRNVFIVSESVFSMDGDLADLPRLVDIKKRYNCFLYIDEAHGVGAMGRTGLGLSEEEGVIDDIDFIVGTFGKALCSVGAFVVCSSLFKQYLVAHSRTLIFTTALPPVNIAWTSFLVDRLEQFSGRRERLKRISMEFAEMLGEKANSHIVPYVLGENKRAIEASEALKEAGFRVLPIRYPTVPKSTARLRFSLNADLDLDELTQIKQILVSYAKKVVK